MAYGSGFANNLPAWKPLAVQTPPVVPSTAAPGPITDYTANQLRMLNHSEPGQMPASGAARPPVSRQVPINNSIGQMTPRSAGIGGATSPNPGALEKLDNSLVKNTVFKPQATVGYPAMDDAFPPQSYRPQYVGGAEINDPTARPSWLTRYQETSGVLPEGAPAPEAPYKMPGLSDGQPRMPNQFPSDLRTDPRSYQMYKNNPAGQSTSFRMGDMGRGGFVPESEPPISRGWPKFGNFANSKAAADINKIAGAAKTVGGALVNNPLTNNALTNNVVYPLAKTAMRVSAPLTPILAGGGALVDKSGYQDPVEKYFGWGNLHDRVDAANADYYAHVNAGDQVGGLKSVLGSTLPVVGHTLYSFTGRPAVEAAEWAYNKLNPVSSAAAEPAPPHGTTPTATPPGSPPPPAATPPAATPPAAQPGMPHTVTVGPQNQSLTDRYPDRFKHVPGFGQVLNGGANSGRTPLSPQEQAYNAEVMRGIQLENRSRELANVDRYRATQLHDRNALATLQATHGGHPLGHALEREQQDPETKGDALRQQMSMIDERRNAVTNALFDQNNPDAASKIMNGRQAYKSYKSVLEALGIAAPTFEEMMQSDYGRTYNPKTGYFATPK